VVTEEMIEIYVILGLVVEKQSPVVAIETPKNGSNS